jgi:hypothetical protein
MGHVVVTDLAGVRHLMVRGSVAMGNTLERGVVVVMGHIMVKDYEMAGHLSVEDSLYIGKTSNGCYLDTGQLR